MRFITLALMLAAAPAAHAAPRDFADPAEIDRAVAQFTGTPIGVAGGAARPIDRRLRLAPCVSTFALAWHGSRRDTVRVECPDAGGWRIFVPLAKAAAGPATRAVRKEAIVARGDMISIAVRGRSFTVMQTGEAMEKGAVGEWIRIKPDSDGEPVRAKIERPGLAVIPVP